MAKKHKYIAVTPATHGPECACPVCRRKHAPATGGRATEMLYPLSSDPYARFTRLYDGEREHNGHMTFCTLSEALARHWDLVVATERTAWRRLQDEHPEKAEAIVLTLDKTQVEAAQIAGCSQMAISRRKRAGVKLLSEYLQTA